MFKIAPPFHISLGWVGWRGRGRWSFLAFGTFRWRKFTVSLSAAKNNVIAVIVRSLCSCPWWNDSIGQNVWKTRDLIGSFISFSSRAHASSGILIGLTMALHGDNHPSRCDSIQFMIKIALHAVLHFDYHLSPVSVVQSNIVDAFSDCTSSFRVVGRGSCLLFKTLPVITCFVFEKVE